MTSPPTERRRRRSVDPITALHYQLAFARTEGGLDAMVLVDDGGALVAGAGAWPVCEELAAFAPLLVHRDRIAHREVHEAADAIRPSVSLRTLAVDGAEIVIAARGPADAITQALLVRAAAGCCRILGAETLGACTCSP